MMIGLMVGEVIIKVRVVVVGMFVLIKDLVVGIEVYL